MSPQHPGSDHSVDGASRSSGPIPAWKLERYALGELPAEELRQLRQQISTDPAAAAQLRALENEDRAIRMQYPAARMAAQIRERAGVAAPTRRISPWVALGPVVAMAAAIALVVLPGPSGSTDPASSGTTLGATTAKGDGSPLLDVILQEGETSLADGAQVAAGDVLGFRYNAAGAEHGVLFSIDGNGLVTLHFPPETIASTLLGTGLVTLDLAYELDDAPDFERFFLVTGQAPFDVETVLEAARALAGSDAEDALPDLPQELQVTDLLLRKSPQDEEAP